LAGPKTAGKLELEEIMKKWFMLLLMLIVPVVMQAQKITTTDEFGPVGFYQSVYSAVTPTSECAVYGIPLVQYNDVVDQTPEDGGIGAVQFLTGAVLTGSLDTAGATLSADGSIVTICGKKGKGIPAGLIFSGAFTGTITWTYNGMVGDDYSFTLSGPVSGLKSSETFTGTFSQTILASAAQLEGGEGTVMVGMVDLAKK
jgi:hypothetical protein